MNIDDVPGIRLPLSDGHTIVYRSCHTVGGTASSFTWGEYDSKGDFTGIEGEIPSSDMPNYIPKEILIRINRAGKLLKTTREEARKRLRPSLALAMPPARR